MVNAIPETVRLESYVRGADFESILSENKKVNRALIGAALSIGANVEIVDMPGYAPLNNNEGMTELAADAFHALFPDEDFPIGKGKGTGSTDMGDLSCVMPVVHPYCAGASGTSHGNDYRISDPQKACVDNAKWQIAMLRLLLENNAARAKEILDGFTPMFANKTDYLAYLDAINDAGNRIEYTEDGARVRL
jgi:metal-dependent amidase/aminoacylase/carboxypeptidase family protein